MNLKQDEERIINALRNSPGLKNCILEMIDIPQRAMGELENGDDAEDAVVDAIQNTGKVLLEQWAQTASTKASDKARQNKEYRPQGKKK